MPGLQVLFLRDHIDAINRAGLDAEIAAGALAHNDGVHLLGSPQNRIHWAGLDTFGAADALVLPNVSDCGDFLFAVFGIQWQWFQIQQVCKRLNGRLATGRAFVDRLAVGDRLGIGSASGKPTLPTLCLAVCR